MERYYITNGDQYLGCMANNKFAIGLPVSKAKKFRMEVAKGTLQMIQDDYGDEWCIQKYRNSKHGENYVITNATKWVSNNGLVVDEVSKAKPFKTAADADSYIRGHGELVISMGNTIIVNEDYAPVDIMGRRINSTTKAREINLGHKSDVKKVKRELLQKDIRMMVYERANGICQMCDQPLDIDNFTVDHVVPLSRGGINDISNYRCLCKRCNEFKSDSLDGELLKMFEDVGTRYFNKHPHSDLVYKFARSWGRNVIQRGEEIMRRRSINGD